MRPIPRTVWLLGLVTFCVAFAAKNVEHPEIPPPPPPPTLGDRLEIDLGDRTLTVFDGERPLKTFPVSLARGGVGKVKRGDGKNPIGTYRLMAGRPSKFFRFLHVTYPNAEDAERGLASGLITAEQAREIVAATRAGRMPPQNTALGGAIGVHGLGRWMDVGPLQKLHRLFNASEGCFVLTDAEVTELETLYRPGAVLQVHE